MKSRVFFEGMKDGLPIGLGYFAVSFSLGIVAQSAGVNAVQGFIASFFCVASAGEYALFNAILSGVSYLEVALVTFVVNCRYLLMSCSLSQKFGPDTKLIHRFFVGFGVTDEIFGISIARPGYLDPLYNYGALAVAVPLWSIGTSLGIIAGNLLPGSVVSAFSVALYGMFLAIIIPPARKNIVIAIGVLVSFGLSWAFSVMPLVKNLSGGMRTILLTVGIAAVLALVAPVPDDADGEAGEDTGVEAGGKTEEKEVEGSSRGSNTCGASDTQTSAYSGEDEGKAVEGSSRESDKCGASDTQTSVYSGEVAE